MHNYQIDFQSSKMGNNIKVRLFEEQIVRHSSGAVILNIQSLDQQHQYHRGMR